MEDTKKCYKCQENKSFSDFNKCSHGTFGLHGHCRACQKETRRAWYLKHQESENKKAQAYSKTPQGKIVRQKRWEKYKHILGPLQNQRRRQEPAKIKARSQRKAWLTIPHNRIAQNLRGRIRAALQGIPKLISTEEITSCSFKELKEHIESLWLPNMSWDNYGDWHIDHIKPCASFDLTNLEQQKVCFHYSNLQPLWADDNRRKSDKV